MIQNISQLSQRAIADTVTVVFLDPAYATKPLSMLEIALRWIGRLIDSIFEFLSKDSVFGPYIRWALIVVAAFLIGRILLAILVHYRPRTFGIGTRFSTQRYEDPWKVAQRYAAAGDYSNAAHALYFAAITSLARSGQVAIDESKTAGDYLRDLRGKPTRQPFADFARMYEFVMYGVGSCDSMQYQTLHTLTNPFRSGRDGSGERV